MVITIIKSTAFTQTSSQDSVKCFTYSQVRQITKEIKKGQLCDSIVQNQELQIINFKSVLRLSNEQISIYQQSNADLKKGLNKANLKIKLSYNLVKFGIPGGIVLGVILKTVLTK